MEHCEAARGTPLRSQRASTADPPGGQDGNLHDAQHLIEQGQTVEVPAHMATSLDPLHNEEIAAGTLSRDRLLQ